MTKLNYKIIHAAILVALAMPLLTLAGPAGDSSADPKFSPKFDKRTICIDMVARIEKWETSAQQRLDKLQQVKAERQNRFDQLKEKRDEQIAKRKAENDKRWEEYFARLEARAQTEAQKQAVLAFKQAVFDAAQARRTAVNAANEAFSASIQSAIDQRKQAVDALADQFRTEVQAAIQIAKNSCGSDTDPTQVRETLRAAIKAARDKFQTGWQAIEKIQDQLEAARDTHKAAIDSAQAVFKTALETAKNALRASLGVSPSPTPTP